MEKEKRRKEVLANTSPKSIVSEDGDSEAQEEGDNDNFEPKQKLRRKLSHRVKLMSPDLTAALDRTKASDRQATFTIAATAKSLGHNVGDLSLSFSTVRRARIKHRKEATEKIHNDFNPSVPLVVHWDSKLLPDITGTSCDKSDRLAILVTGEETEKLLGVPKLIRGTGAAMADATVASLTE